MLGTVPLPPAPVNAGYATAVRLILAVGFVYGCSGKNAAEGDIVDTATCAGVPIVNWANFGEGWLLQECQGCHGSAVTTRHDAPVDMTFDTVDQAWAH